MKILTVPGYTGSGPEHWQSHWERRSSSIERVEQRDWDRPVRETWVDTLDRAVREADDPVVLAAHSLGCATVVHWFAAHPAGEPVAGALLVAPADVDRPEWPVDVTGWRPMPTDRMNAETVVVASRDDPWVSLDRARELARAWGSRFVDAGDAGHLASSAGLGDWPAGWRLLGELVERCGFAPLPAEETGVD